jgi:hypothetical protein
LLPETHDPAVAKFEPELAFNSKMFNKIPGPFVVFQAEPVGGGGIVYVKYCQAFVAVIPIEPAYV